VAPQHSLPSRTLNKSEIRKQRGKIANGPTERRIIEALSPEEGKINAADTHGRVKVIALQG
jgi:hypothetical protein